MKAMSFERQWRAFLSRELRAGRIDRRHFFRLAGAAGIAPLLVGPTIVPTRADDDFVVALWGGTTAEAQQKFQVEPFGIDNGVSTAVDNSGPLPGRLRAMVEEDQVIWDVVDSNSYTSISLSSADLLEPIDYSVVDKSNIYPDGALDYGACWGWYSVVMAYDASRYVETTPNSWADFFNVEKFPGMRAIWKYGYAWEAALLADGVPPEELYPLDTERAIAKFLTIKDQSIYFNSIAEGHAMLRDGEVAMAATFASRAANAAEETDGRTSWSWNQGLMGAASWIVPKGAPWGTEMAMRFIDWTMEADVQIAVCEDAKIGPGNPQVFDRLSPAGQSYDPHNPEWFSRQVLWDDTYYAEHEEMLVGLFLERVVA